MCNFTPCSLNLEAADELHQTQFTILTPVFRFPFTLCHVYSSSSALSNLAFNLFAIDYWRGGRHCLNRKGLIIELNVLRTATNQALAKAKRQPTRTPRPLVHLRSLPSSHLVSPCWRYLRRLGEPVKKPGVILIR